MFRHGGLTMPWSEGYVWAWEGGLIGTQQVRVAGGETVMLLHTPSAFIRCFNRNGERESVSTMTLSLMAIQVGHRHRLSSVCSLPFCAQTAPLSLRHR